MSVFASSLRPAARLVAWAAPLALAVSQASAAIVFVNAAQVLPPASQDGTTWATAYQNLRAAAIASPAGSEFWIAGGTYLPTTTTDRLQGFFAKTNQKLLGGFLPGATSPTDRDPVAHPTILSGDIGTPGFAGDNTYRVFGVANATDVLLDGLIIQDGSNEFTDGTGDGAGLRAVNANGLVVQDCTIRHCSTTGRGGGASFLQADNSVLRRVVFEGNVGGVGGAIDMQSDPITFAACRFLGNTSPSGPGAVIEVNCSGSHFVDCEFSGNVAQGLTGSGGGALLLGAGITVHASTFVGNSAATNGGAIRINLSATGTVVSNCLFADNTAPLGTQVFNPGNGSVTSCGFSSAPVAGAGNGVVVPGLRDPLGPDGVRGTFDDDLRLTSASEAIDRGNGSALPADVADLDKDGNVSEPLPVDAHGLARLVDDLRPDAGLGAIAFLDLGAHEFERSNRIYFVDADVGRDGDGSSWEKAFAKLESALVAVQSEPQPLPVEIWVADGTYVPGTQRGDSFAPQGPVTILGGFRGVEWSHSSRRPLEFPTILSGEIGDPQSADDNSLHVVRFAGDNVFDATVLDGFVITGGNANEPTGNDAFGAGVLVSGTAQPTIRNCRIIGNTAKGSGGGVGVVGPGSRIAMSGCYLAGDVAADKGGAVSLTNGANGSTVVNCTIAGNHAETGGGLAVVGTGSGACVLNTIFAENTQDAPSPGTQHVQATGGGTLALSHCALPCAGTIPFGTNLVSLPPAFTKLKGSDDLIGTLDDDFTLSPESSCIDRGASAAACGAVVAADVNDLDDDANIGETQSVDALGLPRAVDDPLRANADASLAIDIGAAERQEPSGTPGLPGDFDGNGTIDGADLAIFLGQWGTYSQSADLNGDCQVDAADLAVLLGGWTG